MALAIGNIGCADVLELQINKKFNNFRPPFMPKILEEAVSNFETASFLKFSSYLVLGGVINATGITPICVRKPKRSDSIQA